MHLQNDESPSNALNTSSLLPLFAFESVQNFTNSQSPATFHLSPLSNERSELAFTAGAHLIPHPAKIDTGGEDAFIVNTYDGSVLAIADGVSGWAERGVNPAIFSRELMSNAFNILMNEEYFRSFEVNSNPQVLLMKTHSATSSVGSATVIVAMLEKNGILNIANIGDCGLRIIRKGRVVFSTCPQEHYFDCPYQLSSEEASQTYDDAMVCSFKLLEGDTVVVGSDGLFDNVFDHEIISTVSKLKNVSEAAKGLAELANAHSTDVDFDSPYSLEARSRGFDVPFWKKILGQRLIGGKPDDITVIIGHVISL